MTRLILCLRPGQHQGASAPAPDLVVSFARECRAISIVTSHQENSLKSAIFALSTGGGRRFHALEIKEREPELSLVSPFKLNMLTARYLFCLRPERRQGASAPAPCKPHRYAVR